MMIEPMMDALTISTSPCRRAKNAIRNSIALPNVALMREPTTAVVLIDRCCVDLAIRLVIGTTANTDMIKTAVALEWIR